MSRLSSKAPQQTLRPQGPYGLFGKHERSSEAGHTETLEGAPVDPGTGTRVCERRRNLRNARGTPTTPSRANLFTPLARPGPARPAAPPLDLSRGSSRRAGPSFCLLRSHKISQRLPFGILPPVPAPLPYKLSLVLSRLVSIISNEQNCSFLPKVLPTAVICRRVRRRWGGETPLGLFFVAEAAAAADISRRGGGAVRPRWRRPVGWRSCEVNS